MTERTGNTRERIQQVALDLFAEQGYDKTSLREIAERLDVTKAALYYHFKTKDEILGSVLDDYLTEVEELADWAEQQPQDAEHRREVLTRYIDIAGRGIKAARFVQRAPEHTGQSGIGERFMKAMKRMNLVFASQDAPLAERLRTSMGIISVHMGLMIFGPESARPEERGYDPDEVRAAVTEVATELVIGADKRAAR
ncbi:MAG: TetR/AcrR family transcriptional regulator [Streptosporangiales bacterium]|nr:TetR/AcrR family transcriptional regulator [Streptosporangiales bacterium]MBO0891388.1 TetR/AcrR family transcriptional regulator [Acidothermales bacterium]